LDLLKILLIFLILNCIHNKSLGQAIQEADLDSLDIENILHYFDTSSFQRDSNDYFIEPEQIIYTDCSSEEYDLPQELKLYPFKTAAIYYSVKENGKKIDSLSYFIECYGAKQVTYYKKNDTIWKKVIDLSSKYTYYYNNMDSVGFMIDNQLFGLVDSLKSLNQPERENFFSQLKLAAAFMSKKMKIYFAGIGRVCGKLCAKIYIEKIEKMIWYWKKLVLKTEKIDALNQKITLYQADSMKIDLNLTDTIFQIPNLKWIYKGGEKNE